MAITLELIQILDAIDRCGSFEAAANTLHKVRSALTYNIRTYEEATNILLFDRSHYRAQLTPAGKLLLQQGRQLLLQSQKIEEHLKFVATGYEPIVRIAYDEVLNPNPILELLNTAQKAYPRVSFEVFSEVLSGCGMSLASKKVDIAIGVSGRLAELQEMALEPLGKVKWVFAISPKHSLAKLPEPISMQDIASSPTIYARDSANRFPRDGINNLTLSSVTFTSLDMKKQAQCQGLGVGFLPYNLIKEEVSTKKLVIKRVAKPKPDSQYYLGWDPSNEGKVQNFLLAKLRNKNFQKKLFG